MGRRSDQDVEVFRGMKYLFTCTDILSWIALATIVSEVSFPSRWSEKYSHSGRSDEHDRDAWESNPQRTMEYHFRDLHISSGLGYAVRHDE